MNLLKNFTYNSILTLSSYIIGFLVFPHIARVLGVENIGVVGFVDNAINYFIIFAILGLNTVGIRAIAACGDDRLKRSNTFSELIIWTLIFTIVVCILYIIIFNISPKLNKYKYFFYIGLAKLIFTPLLIEWFYSGIENFKYISLRNIIIKILYAFAVFFFVRDSNDTEVYFILTALVVVINSAINLFYARKFVEFRISNLSLFKYFKQIISLGVFQIFISMYTTFNIVYLGLVSNDKEVGYYYTSLKLYVLVTGFFTAFTSVMLPRMSSLVAQDNKEAFSLMIQKSFVALLTFCFPIIIFGFVLAKDIVNIISGPGYEGAIVPLQIMMPMLLIAGMSQLNAIQVLIPLNQDKVLLLITPAVAIVGIIANVVLVPKYHAIGTSLVLLFAECTGAIIGMIYSARRKYFVFPFLIFGQNIISSIPYLIICFLIANLDISSFQTILLSSILCIIYFFFIQVKYLKNEIIFKIFNQIFKN